jgi:molybdenum cofactor synthesis domain-containing protein
MGNAIMPKSMRDRTCALVVIGNEILSGKVQDSNAYFAACELRKLGVALERVTVIPDEVPKIAEEVAYCSAHFDIVITSGGVGPTHDDLTMEGVAAAFGRRIVIHPDLERLIRSHFVGRVNAAGLKMAEVPEGVI